MEAKLRPFLTSDLCGGERKVVSCCSPFILLHKKFRLEELIGFSDVLNLNLNLDLNCGEKNMAMHNSHIKFGRL
jgi:hypothetical protein